MDYQRLKSPICKEMRLISHGGLCIIDKNQVIK